MMPAIQVSDLTMYLRFSVRSRLGFFQCDGTAQIWEFRGFLRDMIAVLGVAWVDRAACNKS